MKRIHCLLTGMIASMAIVVAQTNDQEDVFELSPFEVSVEGDQGYLSTNAISGTSLNTAIRDLPMPLEVINRELIEDLQATDLEESLEYSAGVYTQSFQNNTGANEVSFDDSSPSSTSLNGAFTNTISLRGYTVPNNQRFGFRVGAIVPRYNVVLGGSTDTVTSERIEVVRGPQALLYGINVLSGIVNIIPKEPLFDPAYTVGFSIGNYDYRRASFDATGPVIKQKLAYRFMAAYTEEGSWEMFNSTEREDYALQFKWRITPKYDLFVEVKTSDYIMHGIGPKYFIDNDRAGTSAFEWHNEWNESIVFGQDDVTLPVLGIYGDYHESPFVQRPDFDYPEKLFDYGNNYRISGPDTYFDRNEITYTGLLRAKFNDNLSGEFGIYHVQQSEKTLNVDLRTLNFSRGPIRPTFAPYGFFGRPPTERNVTEAMKTWFNNPEISLHGTRGPLDVVDDELYELTKGTGDPFVMPTFYNAPGWRKQRVTEIPQEFDDPTSNSYDRRYARYVWYDDENDAESTQLRARLAYTFDYDLFSIPANHTFSIGANYIGDIVDFNDAWVAANNDNYVYSSYQASPDNHRQDVDPVYFRDSVLDMTPLRYDGETIAITANPNFNRLADFQSGATSGQQGSTIARSGKREATLWYRGFYGLYQGKFWEDKLHLIAGAREDQYQVKEIEQLMIIDQLRISDVWQGSVDPLTPWYIGDGTGPYKSPDGIPEELDARVREDYARLQELQPRGTVDYNFDKYQKFSTMTLGTSYRIIDPISIYYLFSEGVFPNTGQRDGAYDPIDAEQTVNNEIGLKFDLLDGKISGTISFYKIERENAVYYWGWAPAPSKWHGGEDGPLTNTSTIDFSPQAATSKSSGYLNGRYLPVAYGVAMEYVYAAFEEYGIIDQFPDVGGSFPPSAFAKWGASDVFGRHIHERTTPILGQMYVIASDDTLQNNPDSAVLRRAFEMARSTIDPYGIPFFYDGSNDDVVNNPSNPGSTGANVTFGEDGTGIDGQITFSPTPNYQAIFSYSYQSRGVTSFNMVDPIDENGKNWGTEWDAWIYILGYENFTDPTRPSTFNGGSVRGLDLSFVPQYSGKIWNVYRFSDGILDGLRIGGGVQYIGSAPTSVPIGGNRMAENLYATPDTPERYILDAFMSYKWAWGNADWYLSLRVSNLLDDRMDLATAEYTTFDNTIEKRRTRIYYDPRTWRLNLTIRY